MWNMFPGWTYSFQMSNCPIYTDSQQHVSLLISGACGEPKFNLNETNAKVYGQNPPSESLILAL